MASPGSSLGPGDPELYNFARLTPANPDAHSAFTEAFVYMLDRDDRYHLQFCVADLDRARRIHQARIDLQTGASTDARMAFQVVEGFYRLGIDTESLPDLKQGWRVGRGINRVPNRGVELLTLRSDTPDALSILHCRFRLHPRTGVLLIKSMTKDKKVTYHFRGQARELEHGQERPLCQRENTVFIGSLRFTLEYTVPLEEEQHGEFVALLNGALEAGGDPYQDPPLAFGFLPSDPSNSLQRNFLLSHNTRACGGFGWIHAAIDTTTGEAAAVKALQLKREYDRHEAIRECKMWQDVSGPDGLLELLDIWCEHGKLLHECKKLPEKVYMASPLGRFDLYSACWQEVPWRDQLTMLRQTLEGLAVLHRQGIMHRDTSCRNMLVMSLNPPKAVIHDFGKATRSSHETVPQLGPIPYVAPEVDGVHKYDSMIDSWSWAYSVLVSFGYSRSARTKITPQRLRNLHGDLENLQSKKPHLRDLVNLLRLMLVWEPNRRLAVIDALAHPCWLACSDCDDDENGEESSEEASRTFEARLKKVRRTDTDSSITSNSRLVAVAAPSSAIPDTDIETTAELESTVPTQLINQPV